MPLMADTMSAGDAASERAAFLDASGTGFTGLTAALSILGHDLRMLPGSYDTYYEISQATEEEDESEEESDEHEDEEKKEETAEAKAAREAEEKAAEEKARAEKIKAEEEAQAKQEEANLRWDLSGVEAFSLQASSSSPPLLYDARCVHRPHPFHLYVARSRR